MLILIGAKVEAFVTLRTERGGTHHVVVRTIHAVDGWEHHSGCGEYGAWRLIVSVVRF